MQKNAFFGFCAEISLFCAEILPCGPPLRPHSCAEPMLGVVQNYSFLGDIFTSAMSRTPPRVRADGGYARTGQEIEHVQRLDYDEPVQPNDINVDVREDDEFEFFEVGELMGAGEAEGERMGGQVNREVGAGGVLKNDGEVEGDREQELGVDEVQQQPRIFGRRWANFVRSLLDDARMPGCQDARIKYPDIQSTYKYTHDWAKDAVNKVYLTSPRHIQLFIHPTYSTTVQHP